MFGPMVAKRLLPPALVALAFVGVEMLTAPESRPSLGVAAGDVALAAVGLLLLHVVVAAAARRLGSRAVLVPIVLWSMVWGPEQARQRGLPAGVGWVAPVVLAGVGARAPSAVASRSSSS